MTRAVVGLLLVLWLVGVVQDPEHLERNLAVIVAAAATAAYRQRGRYDAV